MQRAPHRRFWRLAAAAAWLAASLVGTPSHADVLADVQSLREGGCGGLLPPAQALHRSALLDHAAREWATAAMELASAVERSGYRAQAMSGVRISGPASSTLQTLRRSRCSSVSDRTLIDIGMYQRGADTWLLLASAYKVPSGAQIPVLSARVLELVNQVRASGAHCGERSFGPAPPLRFSRLLANVAYDHAADMASHNYFEHKDPAGHTPADRVRAAGYREKLVGENIAYGPQSADEVVRGWMDSPGHCENIMDSRFGEMGIAFAAGHSKQGLYWVQVLAAPEA